MDFGLDGKEWKGFFSKEFCTVSWSIKILQISNQWEGNYVN